MNKIIMILTLSFFMNLAKAEDAKDSIARKQPDSELTILGVTIGKTTLNEVKVKFKTKEIYHEGDAGESLYVVCLKISNGSTIAFESGELGGAEHKVISISVNSPQSPYRLNNICEKTSAIKEKMTLHKTSLGMSPDIVKRLTGKPSKQTADRIEYRYEMQEKTNKGNLDTLTTLTIEFKSSMSTQFTATKTETY
ncbi:MAG: hypothetical protein H7336_00205 [Bacteriovorax sp.]|nr:hypothetical protein [Bacteriovorax sp.]